MASSQFFSKQQSSVTSAEKKELIKTHSLPDYSTASKEQQRIIDAITWIEEPFEFKTEDLDTNLLTKIASYTNASYLHASGNCVLLANLLFYNLKHSRTELAGYNTFPFYKPICSAQASKILLNTPWVILPIFTERNIKDLVPAISKIHQETGEKFFIIYIDYNSLFFTVGHALNAVVLGNKDDPKIIFVDAWKTSKPIYSAEELMRRYPQINQFGICYLPGKISSLQKICSLNRQTNFKSRLC